MLSNTSIQETTDERVSQESPYMLFYEQQGLERHYDCFRAKKGGKRQDIGSTEDDRMFDEQMKRFTSHCCIQ